MPARNAALLRAAPTGLRIIASFRFCELDSRRTGRARALEIAARASK